MDKEDLLKIARSKNLGNPKILPIVKSFRFNEGFVFNSEFDNYDYISNDNKIVTKEFYFNIQKERAIYLYDNKIGMAENFVDEGYSKESYIVYYCQTNPERNYKLIKR